ncbi:MAG: ImmA/IrrE family metallo-endopeptidase [Candidatus Buchananbacteria bacterium]
MGKVAFINRNNLKIARENIGMDVFIASKKISKSKKEYVSLWESGEELPTWSQIKKLANIYGVSELSLVSKIDIEKNKDIPDFRVGLSADEKNDVKKLLNLVLKRQKWLQEFLKKEGYKKNQLLGSGKNLTSAVALANNIADSLKIDLEEIKSMSGVGAYRKALKYLITKAEDQGIFVGKTISYHKIPVEHMRGLFVSNDYCPFIILNRQDSITAQIFSFIHELAHFFRKSESISNSIDFRDSNNIQNTEEVFCNKVAAELLLPEKEFERDNYNKQDILVIGEKYKVSPLFVFYRLKNLKKLNGSSLSELEEYLQKQSNINVEGKRSKNKGGNFYNNMKDSNGELFNKIIASSYFENKINFVEASNLLKFSVGVYEY